MNRFKRDGDAENATAAGAVLAPHLAVELASDIVVSRDTKAAAASPNVNDFKIEIYKYTDSGLLRLYRDTYENTVGQKIRLNSADYKIQARYGDSFI